MLDPLINRTLGRYLIQAEIGRGGMAHVYRALDTVLQRPVALKVLQPSLSADPEFARRFEREAVTAANVRHPAIVTIYDVGEADGLRYIAMEYIAGRTLNEVLQERGRLGLPLTIAILEPVAQALDYAHQQGLVHRDIKPHNIMLDTDGRVLLTDFGIAIGQGEGDERLTRTGVFMGTPEYISPEQAQSQPLTGRSDMYSLAVVAYEMLSGYVPFTGGTAQQIMAHAYQAPPRFTSGDGTQPPELDDIFNRALAKDPAQRFVSAGTLVDALRGVARRYNMAPAPRDAIAELAQPRIGSVGVPTVPMGSTPRGGVASPALVPVARGAGGGGAYQQSANAAGGAAAPVGAVPRGGRAGGGDRMPPGSRLPDRPAEGGGGRWPWAILAIGAIATALAVFGIAQLLGAGNTPSPTPSVPAVIVSATALPNIEVTPLPTATGTTEAIPTDTPTAVPATATTQPTATRVPPTGTPVPPTATVAPTDTPTPLPPTDTPTVAPTDTPVPLPTVPPTATPPPPTDTPPPPTDTPPPPTATTAPAATATATTVAVATPTATQAPVPTPTTPLPSPSVIGGGGGRTVLSLQPDGTLVQRNLDTNETTVVRGGLDPNSPLARNSDGTTLYASNGQIFVLNDDRQLTDEGINTQPNWGLDNNTIVFASTRDGGNADIYAMNESGGSEDRLTTNAANDAYPTLGNGVVVFERQRGDGGYDLFTIPLNGDDDDDAAQPAFPQRVGVNDRYPRWSPTGAQLAFTGSGGSEIVIADAQSTIITTIAAPNGVTWGGATWSPDGTKLIAFDAGGSGLYAIDAATQAVQPLADSAGQRWPVWTP